MVRPLLLAALAMAPRLAAQSVSSPSPSAAGTGGDTLRVYYMGYPIGYERWSIGARDGGGYEFTADLDYTDRARRTHLAAAMRLANDWSPERLQVTRLSDTASRTETRVAVHGREASIERTGRSTHVTLPRIAFAIAGHTPVSQHLILLRYWLAHGRPSTLAVVPGGATNDVHVARLGRDTLSVDSRRVILDRYAVDGVVWGREAVWLDEVGRLAAFVTAGGGGLMLEAVRVELMPYLRQLRRSSTRDRMADLMRWSRSVRPVASGKLALVGATLIDGTGRPPVSDAAIIVDSGRIVAVGASTGIRIPGGVRRIDMTGKTIMPGLWEMHTHLMQVEWAPVYLAAGVTTVRDMGNVIDFIVPFRATVDSGHALGPRMLLAGLVDGGGPNAFGEVNAESPDEGRSVVRRYHELGFEQVKLYSLLTPAVVGAIAADAHHLGMTVTGHVPIALSLLAAVDSGMDQIAHLPIRGDAQSDSVRQLIDSLRAHGTVIDPTTSWGELLGHSTAEPVSNFQPGIAHLPPVLAQRIGSMGAAGIDTATAHGRLARTLGVIRALHEAGVPIVAGTDEGVPGYSIYRELELYVRAGFTPIEALRAGTAIPARVMRLDDREGTLQPGMLADLVVLDRNPLEDIANIRSGRFVMKGGVLYRSADIWHALGFH